MISWTICRMALSRPPGVSSSTTSSPAFSSCARSMAEERKSAVTGLMDDAIAATMTGPGVAPRDPPGTESSASIRKKTNARIRRPPRPGVGGRAPERLVPFGHIDQLRARRGGEDPARGKEGEAEPVDVPVSPDRPFPPLPRLGEGGGVGDEKVAPWPG